MKKMLISLLPALAVCSTPVAAVDGDAVLGGAVGGGLGAAVGSEIGGRNGAIAGGAIGAAVGVAVAADDEHHHSDRQVIVVEQEHHHHDGRRAMRTAIIKTSTGITTERVPDPGKGGTGRLLHSRDSGTGNWQRPDRVRKPGNSRHAAGRNAAGPKSRNTAWLPGSAPLPAACRHYRFSGAISRSIAAKLAWDSVSTGRCTGMVPAG